MVEILLKDKQKYLHAVYMLTLDALLQTHGWNYREFENVLEACWMDKIPSVRGKFWTLFVIRYSWTKNQKRLELGLCVTDKRCCTNFLTDTKYFVDPPRHE